MNEWEEHLVHHIVDFELLPVLTQCILHLLHCK